MRLPLFGAVRALWKRRREPAPLAPLDSDMRLLQRLRARQIPGWLEYRHLAKILDSNERRLFYASFAVFMASAVWLVAGVYRSYRVEVQEVGGRYVEGVVGAPEFPNPIFASASDVDADIVRLLYNGLLRLDDRGRLVPDLAAAYEVSADKKVYTFTLRRDVRWHDGEQFTARDVFYTFEAIQNPLVSSPLFVTFQGVSVSVLDSHTVQFTLKEPFPPFLASLTVGILPEHLWGDVSPERMRLHKYNLQPVGTGPYLFRKFLKDDAGRLYRYDLVRNAFFYREPPFVEEFSFEFFGDYEGPSGAIQAFREEKIDGLSFVPRELRDRVLRKRVALHTLELPQYTALFLNADRKALKDPAVREALERAIDKQRIVRETLSDEGVVIWGPILSGFPGFEALTTTTPYDSARANDILDVKWTRISASEYRSMRRAELAKESSPEGFATTTAVSAPTSTASSAEESLAVRLAEETNPAQTFFRKGKNGDILRLEIVTADTPEYRQAAESVSGFWQEVGVATRVKLISPKDIARAALRQREYDVLLFGVIIGSDPDQFPFWHSSQTEYPGLNFSRYANRSVDALLEKARSALDEAALADIYKKIGATIAEDRPAIFLFIPTYTYATTEKVLGVAPGRVFHPADRLNAVSRWYVKTKSKWKFK